MERMTATEGFMKAQIEQLEKEKKSGLEKLIELLNEYEKLNMCRTFIGYYKEEEEITGDIFSIKACELISKKFGFIKWLVDNDKIDRDRVDDQMEYHFFGYTNYQILLMLLSISDTPIDDLISYLK